MKNRHNMTQLKCLADYLRNIHHALSYDAYYHPEYIANLQWAKEPVEIMSNSEQIERELSEAVTIPEMGEELSQLVDYVRLMAHESDCSFFNYNDVSLQTGYQSQWDKFENLITEQESITDNLENEVAALERRQSNNSVGRSSLELRIQNRKQRLEQEQEKLNELYTKQNKLTDYLQIIDSCYCSTLDEVARQCRELLPVVVRYYDEWQLANPSTDSADTNDSDDSIFEELKEIQRNPNEFLLPDVHTSARTFKPQHDFFSPSLIIQIYELCNGQQFEECNSTTFIDAINLRTNGTTLRIKDKEKVRVCYLINRLWSLLQKDNRETWLSQMLDSLGISRKFYNSKYSVSPREIDRSKATNAFYFELKNIFSMTIS